MRNAGSWTLQVLIIHGDADGAVPLGNSVRLVAMVPGARLVTLPACGHVPQEEEPHAFVDAVVHFLQHVAAAAVMET